MAWVIYLGMQELHPGSESWLAEWGQVLSLSNAMSALEECESKSMATLLPQGKIEDYEALSLWLKKHSSAHCTLVYPQAVTAISQRLQHGCELEDACREWREQAQALLILFRQHRRQLTLLTWPGAANMPEVGGAAQVPLPKHSASHEIEPIYSLLAQQALAQDAQLAEATRYLAASTHNAAQCQAAGLGLGAMLERHRQEQQQQRRDQQAQAEGLQALRAERDQARYHSEKLQQSLDTLEQQSQAQREQLVALQVNHDQAQASRQEREEEHALLLEQLHSAQEELEQALLTRQGLEQQLRDSQAAQGELQQRLKQTQSRLKAEEGKRASLAQKRDQLHAERDRLNGQRKEGQEERARLQEQLQSAQEELEQALLTREGMEKQLRQFQAVQGELDQRLKQTQSQLKAEEGKRASLEKERDQLHVERDRLNGQCKEGEEENALLLEQLHGVQEELERRILDSRDQAKRHNQLDELHQQQELFLQWLLAFATRINCAFYKKRPAVLKEHKALLASSANFDADWYTRSYPDVAESGIEPEVHYLKFGVLEGRNPCAGFDTRYYITANPDIVDAGEHPLLHYIRWGRDEQRQATPRLLVEEVR